MERSGWSRDEPATYQIRVRGELEQPWAVWFGGLDITNDTHGNTTLAGLVVDQTTLYGLISRARDLDLTLIAVARSEPETQDRG